MKSQPILYFTSLDSTNTYLKQHLSLPDGAAVSADIQTAGKGRLGRVWQTPKGNLSLSVLFHQPQGELLLYPLLCAIAVWRLLTRYTDKPVGIKWPNDLVVDNKKISGILCESVLCGNVSLICGMGVNLSMTADELQEGDLPYGTSLQLITQKLYDNRVLAKELLEELQAVVETYQAEGFSKLQICYEKNLVNIGKDVQVLYQSETVRARCLGVTEKGHLICENERGQFTVQSGEASVRGLYGYI